MISSFLGSSRRNLALISVAAAIAASACSTSTGSGASPLSQDVAIKPSTTYMWNWVKVDDNNSGTSNTEVTGINNLAASTDGPEIVGNNFTTGTSAVSYSFTAFGPNYKPFTDVSWPRTKGGATQMNAIAPQASPSALPVLVGSVSQPGDDNGDFPAINNQGLWSYVPEDGCGGSRSTKSGDMCAGYLFGVNDNQVAVGYHTNGTAKTPTTTAYEVSAGREQFMKVPFPSNWTVTDSIAYGINDNGDMVGTATIETPTAPTAVSEGWYALCTASSACGTGSKFTSYCWQTLKVGTKTTTPYGIDYPATTTTRQVVGSYANITGPTTGFLTNVSPPTKPGSGVVPCVTGSTQASITVHSSTITSTGTVVRGINNVLDIVGSYTNSTGTHGFVGTLKTGSAKRRRSH